MENQQYGMGWLPDYPDFRDYTFEIKEMLELIDKADFSICQRNSRRRKRALITFSTGLQLRKKEKSIQ